MIVQLPIVCTDRMKPLQRECVKQNRKLWFANFDDRPAKLFDGLEHIRATIIMTEKGEANPSIYATNYNRWYSEQRSDLFANLQFHMVSDVLREGSIPKIGDSRGYKIMKSILEKPALGRYLSRLYSNRVLYHNAPQYWIRSVNYDPFFWNERDGHKLSTQIKTVYLADPLNSEVVVATINSSLFYWWFIILSDCRHLNLREIENLPLDLGSMSIPDKQSLLDVVSDLMTDYQKNARRKTAFYKTTGRVEYDEFYPRLSKRIIDEVDRILRSSYGFSDEDLDYIINYDIKFRMGDELY